MAQKGALITLGDSTAICSKRTAQKSVLRGRLIAYRAIGDLGVLPGDHQGRSSSSSGPETSGVRGPSEYRWSTREDRRMQVGPRNVQRFFPFECLA